MISKKNKQLFMDFALFETGVGIVGSINIEGTTNPQAGLARGVASTAPIAGTLIGTKFTLDLLNDFNKYTKKRKNNDMLNFNL